MSLLHKLSPSVMNYPWGKLGKKSLASHFLTQPVEDKNYAEFWYGAHPKAPSQTGNSDLLKVLTNNPKILGDLNSLPFLAKFLSINKALSIQCHPSKEQALRLHSIDPLNYPDQNHKPEIAIAITPVRLLHGWIGASELSQIKVSFPEVFLALSDFGQFDNWNCLARKQILSNIFKYNIAEKVSNQIVQRLLSKDSLNKRERSFLDLINQYGNRDNGVILSLFLRLLELKPFESIFTACGEIHAYIDGDLFECMASSDNVLRAGLTNKFQSLENLISCANFEEGQVQAKESSSSSEYPNFNIFESDCNDFKVLSNKNHSSELILEPSPNTIMMLIVYSGTAVLNSDIHLSAGQAVFIGANSKSISLRTNNCRFFQVIHNN